MLNKSKNYIHYTHHLDQDANLEVVGHEALDSAKLATSGVVTPISFVVSSLAFDDFIVSANIVDKIAHLLEDLDYSNPPQLETRSDQIQALILHANFPNFILNPIVQAYKSSSGFSDKYVAVKPSWILPSNLQPEEREKFVNLNVKGEASLLYHIKKSWAALFSPEALIARGNAEIEEGLSMAVLIQKMVQSEISGSVYTSETVNSGNNYIEIEALLGINDPVMTAGFVPDIYKVDPTDFKIVEKNILAQEYMVILKGRAKPDEEHLMKVDISAEWKRKQKLDDRSIESLAETAQQLKDLYGHDLEIHWGYEAGKIYIISVRQFLAPSNSLELNIDSIASELYGTSIIPEVDLAYITPEPPIEVDVPIKVNKEIDYDVLAAEVNDIAAKTLPELPDEEELVTLKPESIDEDSFAVEESDAAVRLDTVTQVLFDISKMDSASLSKAGNFKGVFFDATQMLIRHKHLPEAVADSKGQMTALVESYALEISTAARAAEPNPLLYMFSDVTSNARMQLVPSSNEQLDGCERFLLHPEAMLVELAAIKRARSSYAAKNISIVLPKVRSEKELLDVKKIISSQGLHRSASFKLYIEIALPISLFELTRLRVDDIDGVIFNLPKLGEHMFGREELINADYEVMIHSIDMILDEIEQRRWQVGIVIPPEHDLVRKSFHIRPSLYVFSRRPDEETVELIRKYEKEHLQKAPARRGRKPKGL